MKEKKQKHSLGDLIVALFDEANKVAARPAERHLLVHAALRHLLMKQVRTAHPIILQR